MKPSPSISWKLIVAWVVGIILHGSSFGQLPSRKATPAPSVPPIAVVETLDTDGAVANPAPGTIVFDGPDSTVGKGAKGLLFKANPPERGAGSTWEFTYRRYGLHLPVQII